MATESSLKNLTPYFLFLLLTATSGPLLFGYHIAELNAPSAVITCEANKPADPSRIAQITAAVRNRFGKPSITTDALPQCIPMDPTQFGLVSSFFTLGGLIGALAAGPLTGKVGRIRTMLYAAVLATIGPIFEALAPNIGVFAFGRLVAGLGAGAAMVVVPIYIFDIAPPGRKGLFGSFTQVMVNGGILVTQVLGYFLSQGQLWRIILAAGGAIGLTQTISLLVAGQESPRYLADHGQAGRAKRVLQKIRGGNVDIAAEVAAWGASDRGLEDEEETLLANSDVSPEETFASPPTKPSSQDTLGAMAVLTHPETRQAVFAIVMIMLAQQFTGINSIVMYGVGILSELLPTSSALLNVFISAINVVLTAAAAPLVDRLGRKTCLLLSITGMGIMSLLLALGIKFSIPLLSAVAVILFVASFSLGLGPIPFILASEFVDARAVGATQSWALAMNWTATFVIAQFFPVLNAAMGKGEVYFIFAAMAAFFWGFVAWYVPETKGKRDADEVWGRRRTERVD